MKRRFLGFFSLTQRRSHRQRRRCSSHVNSSVHSNGAPAGFEQTARSTWRSSRGSKLDRRTGPRFNCVVGDEPRPAGRKSWVTVGMNDHQKQKIGSCGGGSGCYLGSPVVTNPAGMDKCKITDPLLKWLSLSVLTANWKSRVADLLLLPQSATDFNVKSQSVRFRWIA